MVEIHDEDLASLVERAEDATVDFKSWKVLRNPHQGGEPNRSQLAEQLVGFANRDGGDLVIGVDDESREPEGEPIDEERTNQLLAEVAVDDCEPNVQWGHSFYSAEAGDLDEGDVYVVHIKKRSGPPHAITYGEGKREFRIRAGDETRLVTTDELDWLFRNQDIPSYYQRIDSGLIYHKDFDPLSIELPSSHGFINRFLFDLSEEDQAYLTSNFQRMMSFAVAIAPFAFVRSLGVYHLNSWDVDQRRTKRDRMPFSTGFSLPSPNSVEPNLEVSMEEVGHIQIEGLDSSILDDTSLQREDLVTDGEFKVPPAVDVTILVGEAAEASDYYGNAVILFTKEDKFEFAIEFGQRMGGGSIENTLLDWHPVANLIKLGDYGKPALDPVADVEFSIRFLTAFKFPDYVDNEYQQHTTYAENLLQILRSDWDLDEFLDDLPDHIQYEMNYKLDMLVDAFDLK